MMWYLVLFFVIAPIIASSESDDFYDEQAGIVAVPVKKFSAYASDVSQALYEGSTQDYGEACYEEWSFEDIYDEDEVSSDSESEAEACEYKKFFIATERELYESTLLFLRDRGYPSWMMHYYRMVRDEKEFPSAAVITLAKQMLEDAECAYVASELLEVLVKKMPPFEQGKNGYEYMEVESTLCRLLSPYFLATFNRIVAQTSPQEPTAPLYTALKKCAGFLACDPNGSWDDVERHESYVYEFCQRHLAKYAQWYLDKVDVPLCLSDLTHSVLLRAHVLFGTTTYGYMENRYDLLFLLRMWNFRLISGKTKYGKKQHIWLRFPYQVRIDESGKVTVAFLQEDPLKHEQRYGTLKLSTLTRRDKSGEILKLSTDGQEVFLVPAFIKEEKYKRMWALQDVARRKELMARAHHYIDRSYIDFMKAER